VGSIEFAAFLEHSFLHSELGRGILPILDISAPPSSFQTWITMWVIMVDSWNQDDITGHVPLNPFFGFMPGNKDWMCLYLYSPIVSTLLQHKCFYFIFQNSQLWLHSWWKNFNTTSSPQFSWKFSKYKRPCGLKMTKYIFIYKERETKHFIFVIALSSI